MKPTWTSRLPWATSASTMRRAPSAVVASGFSQKQGLAGGDGGENVGLVGGAPRGDEHRIDAGGGDELLAGGEDLGLGGDVGLHRRRARRVDVRQRDDPAPART